jgi:hypothetical protein
MRGWAKLATGATAMVLAAVGTQQPVAAEEKYGYDRIGLGWESAEHSLTYCGEVIARHTVDADTGLLSASFTLTRPAGTPDPRCAIDLSMDVHYFDKHGDAVRTQLFAADVTEQRFSAENAGSAAVEIYYHIVFETCPVWTQPCHDTLFTHTK